MHLYTFPSNHPFVQRSTTITSDAYFRIFTSLIGITTVDTHLALRAEADADSEILKLTSEQFADLLAGEMFGPRLPRQSTRLKRTVDTVVNAGVAGYGGAPRHHLPPRGLARAKDQPDVQRAVHRVVNPLLRDLRVAVCKARKRGCFEKHVNTREELEAASHTSAVPIGMWSKRRKCL